MTRWFSEKKKTGKKLPPLLRARAAARASFLDPKKKELAPGASWPKMIDSRKNETHLLI
jgi:hypothetical protein